MSVANTCYPSLLKKFHDWLSRIPNHLFTLPDHRGQSMGDDMTEEISNTNTGGDAGAAGRQQNQETPKTFSQDELNKILAEEKRAYQKRERELKAKADEWDKFQESRKSESQKAAERVAELEKENASLKAQVELERARIKYGRLYNIPEEDWDRIRGSTPQEIEEDAKAWSKSRGLDRAGGPTPKGGSGSTRDPFNQAFLNAVGRGGR